MIRDANQQQMTKVSPHSRKIRLCKQIQNAKLTLTTTDDSQTKQASVRHVSLAIQHHRERKGIVRQWWDSVPCMHKIPNSIKQRSTAINDKELPPMLLL
jgi:hypothetical protein